LAAQLSLERDERGLAIDVRAPGEIPRHGVRSAIGGVRS
jgi:hypothetical protein